MLWRPGVHLLDHLSEARRSAGGAPFDEGNRGLWSGTQASIVASPELCGVLVGRYSEFSSDHRWSFWPSHHGVSLTNSNQARRACQFRVSDGDRRRSQAVKTASTGYATDAVCGRHVVPSCHRLHTKIGASSRRGVELDGVGLLLGQPANPPPTLVRPTVGRDVVGFPVGFHRVDARFTDHRNTRYAGLSSGGEGTRTSRLSADHLNVDVECSVDEQRSPITCEQGQTALSGRCANERVVHGPTGDPESGKSRQERLGCRCRQVAVLRGN